MAWATCNDCGSEVRWSAKRGSRLAALRCPCGGTLRGVVAWRPERSYRSRSLAMSIRTPEEYRQHPNLRAAFRAGVQGRSFEVYFRPAELEALWSLWPENIRALYRAEEEKRRAAFRAGAAARQRAIESATRAAQPPPRLRYAVEAAAAPREPGAASLKAAVEVRTEADPSARAEVARAHPRKIAETLGITQAVSAEREGNRLTVTADSRRWVYRFATPYAAARVKDIVLAKAAEEMDWIPWWFELFAEQCGGQLLERTEAAAESVRASGVPVIAVCQGGENEAKREEKPDNARKGVENVAKAKVANMHFFHNEQHGNLRAVCSLQVGDWIIHGVRVVEGKNGPFVSLPGREVKGKDGERTYQDIAHPVTKEGREQLNKAVLDAYHQGLSQQQEQAQEQVAER